MSSSSKSGSIPKGNAVVGGSRFSPSAGARFLGPADGAEIIGVTVVLRRRLDGAPVPNFEHFEKTPWNKRRRLSPEEFAARHGASPEDAAAVVAFAERSGLTVGQVHLGRRAVVLSGTAAALGAAFSVKLGRYERMFSRHTRGKPAKETHLGYEGFVHIPANL